MYTLRDLAANIGSILNVVNNYIIVIRLWGISVGKMAFKPPQIMMVKHAH